MVRHASWHVGFGYLLGLAGVAIGLWLVAAGAAHWAWLLLWPVVHTFNTVIVSAGLHRYFSHGCFKTSRFWHNFMALYSPTMLYGSPYAWATAHVTHHVHSDTDRDPHHVDWRYLLFKQFRDVPLVQGRFRRIVGDPVLDFVHRYWLALYLAYAAVLLAVSPKLFVFAHLMPMGTAQLFGVVHQLVSHRGGGPRDLPLMEFLVPTGGEWQHKAHHDRPGLPSFRTRWWHLDMGAAFIRLIRTN